VYGDHAERDRIAEQLLRRRTPGATDLADLLDYLAIDDEERRRDARVLGEMEADQ